MAISNADGTLLNYKNKYTVIYTVFRAQLSVTYGIKASLFINKITVPPQYGLNLLHIMVYHQDPLQDPLQLAPSNIEISQHNTIYKKVNNVVYTNKS